MPRRTRSFSVLAAVALCLPNLGIAQPVEVEVHSFDPPTTNNQISDIFAVRINGQAVNVQRMVGFNVDTDNGGVTDGQHHYVHFSMRGPVDIEVDFLDTPAPPSYWIRPKAFKVNSSRVNNTVSFELYFPHYYVLRTDDNGNRHELYILADYFDENAPEPTDPNVLRSSDYLGLPNDGSTITSNDFSDAMTQIQNDPAKDIFYFEPGHYEFIGGGVGLGHHSGAGTYIAGGSVIRSGGFHATWQEGFWVRGRGALDYGTVAETGRPNGIRAHTSRNFAIEGIVSRGSREWNITARLSDDIFIKDLKVVNAWNTTNNDGIDTDRARRFHLEKAFVSASADNNSDKANGFDGSWYIGITRDVRDIYRGDVVTNSDAKSQKFGTETNADTFENILFEDFFAVNNGGPQSHIADSATFRNITFRNWHIDEEVVTNLIIAGWAGRNPTTGNINGMVLEDIYSYGSTTAAFGGYSASNLVQNVDITNLYLSGDGFATSTADLSNMAHTANFTVTTAPTVWAAHDRFGLVNQDVPMNGYAYHGSATWTKTSGPGNVLFANANDPETTVTFDARGEYVIRITADNTPTEFDELTVTVLDPTFTGEPKARFIMLPTFPLIGQSITFDGSYSSDPDGSVVQYDWDFGDGTLLTDGGATPTHSYANAGRFSVSLVITDDGNNTRTVYDFILVREGQQPFGGVAQSISGRVQAEDFDTGGPNMSYVDNSRGDGGDDVSSVPISQVYRPVEQFIEDFNWTPVPDIRASTDAADAGGYELFHIDSKNGVNEWISYTLDVTAAGIYDLTFRVNPGELNVDRYFSIYLDDVKMVDHEKWGRSNTYIDKTVTGIVIGNTGEHVIRIEFESDITSLNYMDFVLTGTPVPNACFTPTPASGFSPLEVTVDAACSDGGGGTLTRYDWNFGDGTVINDGSAIEVHTFTEDGSYTITLTVTSNSANIDQATGTVFVGNLLPTASFNFAPGNPDPGQTVSFDGSSSSDPDGTLTDFDWDFGDGTILNLDGTGSAPTHSYATDGSYTITLTVTDDQGDSDQFSGIIFVGNQPPVANLVSDKSTGLVPMTVRFNARGSTDPESNPLTYDWDFGDGTTLTDAGATPQHTYTAEGSYTATVTVIDSGALSDQASIGITVVTPGSSNLIYHFDFDANGGNGSTVNDVSGFGTAAPATTYTGNPPVPDDLFTASGPGDGFGGDFTASRSNMTFDAGKFNDQVSGESNAFTFIWTMQLLGFTSGGNDADRAFLEDTNGQLRIGAQGSESSGGLVGLRLRIGGNSMSTAPLDASSATVIAVTYSTTDNSFLVYTGSSYADLALHDRATLSASSIPSLAGLRVGDTSSRDPDMFIDDIRLYDNVLNLAELHAIGAPPPMPTVTMVALTQDASNWILSFPSELGFSYQVRTATTLASGPSSWTPIDTAQSGDGTILEFHLLKTIWPADPRRFFVVSISAE